MQRQLAAALGVLIPVLSGCNKAPATSHASALGSSSLATGSALPTPSADRTAVTSRPRYPPRVTLSGQSNPVPSTLPGSPRLHARALRVWVQEGPSRESRRIGALRAGSSSPTTPTPVGREGCPDGWYPVQPQGYVCAGREATLDPNDPIVVATRDYLPDPARKLPYIYGTVRRPGPVYQRLPTATELAGAEADLDDRMQRWLGAEGETGSSYAQHVWLGRPSEPIDPARAWSEKTTDKLPDWLSGGKTVPSPTLGARDPREIVAGMMKPRAGYSFLRAWLWQGRRYALTPELTLMPTDRFRPIQGSEYHGVEIGPDKGVEFPFALVRRRGTKTYVFQKSSNRLLEADEAPYFAAVALTGKQNFFRGRLYYETREGKWLSDSDASRLDPARRMPKWGKNGEKWMDVNLTKQTVVLYEGERAVYATLISSGEAGLEDPEHTTATKRGIFRIHTKHLTATMSSEEVGEEFELRDVPYVEYFEQGGYALHGAYWHDRFGTPKSHGCLNLTPEDARRIFWWTEPELPVGWHSVLKPLTGTTMFIHP